MGSVVTLGAVDFIAIVNSMVSMETSSLCQISLYLRLKFSLK